MRIALLILLFAVDCFAQSVVPNRRLNFQPGGSPAAWTGPTFVASGTQVTGTGAVTPGIPTGMLTNDVMLLFVESAGSNAAAPASWTLITNAATGTLDAVNATAVDVFWRRVIAGEAFPSAPTVTDRGNHTLAVILGFRGCETNGNPWCCYTNNVDSTTNTTVSINSQTTTVASTLIVQVDTSMFDIATNQFFSMANANLGAFTTITNGGTVSGNGGGWWIGAGNLTNSGASGVTTGYATNTTTEAAVSIALMPVQPDVTAPLLLATSSVDSTGTNWLLQFNENVYTNASLAGLVAPSNSALGTITNLTFVTGSGSNALHFYNSPQITSNGVVTYVSFTNAANAIEDLAGNDLASTNVVSVVNNSTQGGAPPTYIVSEDFEGTGYEESWSEDAGTPDEDYTGVVLAGSQSYRVNVTASTGFSTRSFTAMTNGWAYFMFRPVSIPNAANSITHFIGNFSQVGECFILTDGKLRVDHGNVNATTTDAMSAGTTYHVWLYYQKGTGANGVASVEFATTATKVGSGNKFAQVTTGDATDNADQLRIGLNVTTTADCIWDKVRVDDVAIGSDPQ